MDEQRASRVCAGPRSSDNRLMDADELARIAAALVAAIADASARAKEIGIDSEFREIVGFKFLEAHDIGIGFT